MNYQALTDEEFLSFLDTVPREALVDRVRGMADRVITDAQREEIYTEGFDDGVLEGRKTGILEAIDTLEKLP